MQYLRIGPKTRRAAYRQTTARLHLAHQVSSLFIGQADGREIHFFVESGELRRGDPDIADGEAAPICCVGSSPDSAPFQTSPRPRGS